jgi:hypothetical protein
MTRHPERALAALLLAIVVAGCGSSSVATPAPTSGRTQGPATSAAPDASLPPDATAEPAPTEVPASTEAPVASVGPGATTAPEASAAPGSPGPDTSASAAPGPAGCSGSAENRDFFAAAAESVSWDVYCAVLGEGWFVDAGAYRLADGGRLDVTYRGPAGERIELQEGAYCTSGASACSPRDHEIGPAAFGDRTGTLATLGPSESDGFAIYVDPGAAPSWAITGSGMDQATFVSLAAALLRVSR